MHGEAGQTEPLPVGARPRRRVLHVITRLDRGGSAENTLLTVAGLDPEVYEITLASGPTQGPLSPTWQRAQQRGVRFVHLADLVRSPHPWHDPRALRQLQRLCDEGFDLVHTHTSKAGILGRLAAHRAGVRHIVHTPHGHVFYGYYPAPVARLFIALERRAARWCGPIVALTRADLEDHVRFGVAPASQFTVIHSGVDLGALDRSERSPRQIRAELGLPASAYVIANVGRLTSIKGQDDLLRAAADLEADVWVLFAGDGEQAPALRSLAARLGIEGRVVFAGWRTDIADLLRSVDAFAFPSLNEGMGKALVEAMYLQRPVVATAVGGVPELIHDRVHGLLVPPRAPDRLAGALRLLRQDPVLCRRLVRLGRIRSLDFGVDAMVAKIDSLYRQMFDSEPLAVKA